MEKPRSFFIFKTNLLILSTMGNNTAVLGEKEAVKGKELNSKALPVLVSVFL